MENRGIKIKKLNWYMNNIVSTISDRTGKISLGWSKYFNINLLTAEFPNAKPARTGEFFLSYDGFGP